MQMLVVSGHRWVDQSFWNLLSYCKCLLPDQPSFHCKCKLTVVWKLRSFENGSCSSELPLQSIHKAVFHMKHKKSRFEGMCLLILTIDTFQFWGSKPLQHCIICEWDGEIYCERNFMVAIFACSYPEISIPIPPTYFNLRLRFSLLILLLPRQQSKQ